MKYLLPIFLFLLSCSVNQYERNMKIMTEKVKTDFENAAFDENGKIEFHEFVPVKYDTASENILYSFEIEECVKRAKQFREISNTTLELARTRGEQMLLYAEAGMKTLVEMERKKLDKGQKEIQAYADSVKHYTNRVEELNSLIEQNKNPKPLYRYFIYLKMTFTDKKGETENIRDTMMFLFNENLEFVPRY